MALKPKSTVSLANISATAEKPAVVAPVATAPVAVKPVAAAPVAVKQEAVKQEAVKPAAAKIVATQPVVAKPAAVKVAAPKAVAPKVAAPKVAAPKAVAPKTVASKAVAPMAAAPKAAAPKANIEAVAFVATNNPASVAALTKLSQTMFKAFRQLNLAQFEHVKGLTSATSLKQAMELQNAFAREQVALAQKQTQEIAELAQNLAKVAFQPLTETFGKSFASK